MAETIQSIRVKLVVDTNKMTYELDEEVDSLSEAIEKVEAFQQEIEELF